MFEKISNTWGLMGESWEVLKKDKRLLMFPLLSGVCCLLVVASFVVPMAVTGSWQPPRANANRAQEVSYYGMLFLFYLCNYFVTIFFNTAIIACAVRRMQGGEATVSDGLGDAVARLPLIAGWALVSATVGLILRIVEDRSERVGRIVAGLLGMAWTVASYLVVPILVVERKGPFAALKDSTVMLRRTWGQQVVGSFSFGLMFFVLALPAFGLVVLGIVSGSMAGLFLCIGIAVVYLVLLSLIQSALQSIFQAAVYLYARDGHAPGFSNELLSGSLQPR
jgi:hypothetical protein